MSVGILLKDCLACSLLLPLFFVFSAPAYAQGSKPQESPHGAEKQSALIEQLAANPKVKQPDAVREAFIKHGTARLIVNIDTPGAMAGYDRLEDRVKAAQDKVIRSFSPSAQQSVVTRFNTIYAFVVKATPEQLADILEQQDVRSVEYDARVRALSRPSSVQ